MCSFLRSCIIMCFCGSRRLSDPSIATVASSSLAVVEARVSYNSAFYLFLIFETGWQCPFSLDVHKPGYYNYL